MYESYYGLKDKPFQLNPDPAFYFGSKPHARAMAYLDYGLHQNQGFIVITGEVGAGKTTIIRNMLNKLDQGKIVAGQLVSTQLDAEDTLRLVGAAFGIPVKNVPKSELLMLLEGFFTVAVTKGQRCLLIVDEAQNLTPKAVEELRMLSNFQYDNLSLLQTFLVGQPEFRSILQSPEMLQLRQRVIASCHIGPLEQHEVQEYVEHRLKCAGYKGAPMFNRTCYELIHQATTGIPRRINTLCDRILLRGFIDDKKVFSKSDVEEIAREIQTEYEAGGHNEQQIDNAGQTTQRRNGLPRPISLSNDSMSVVEDELSTLLEGNQLESLRRLERSMLRIENSNEAILGMLQLIVKQLQKPMEPETKP